MRGVEVEVGSDGRGEGVREICSRHSFIRGNTGQSPGGRHVNIVISYMSLFSLPPSLPLDSRREMMYSHLGGCWEYIGLS